MHRKKRMRCGTRASLSVYPTTQRRFGGGGSEGSVWACVWVVGYVSSVSIIPICNNIKPEQRALARPPCGVVERYGLRCLYSATSLYYSSRQYTAQRGHVYSYRLQLDLGN